MSEQDANMIKSKAVGLKGIFWMFSYLAPYRRLFYPALVALFITAGLSLFFPYLLGKLVGGNFVGGGVLGEKLVVDPVAAGREIQSIALSLIGVLALQSFIAFWRINWFIRAGESALSDLRMSVFQRLVRLPMNYYSKHRVGETASRLSSDLDTMRETLITTFPQVIRHSVLLVVGLTFILTRSFTLALFMLACVPVVVVLIAIFGRKIRAFSRTAQDRLAETSTIVTECLQSITSVKAFANESYETMRYRKSLDLFVSASVRGALPRAAFVSFVIFVLFGVITLVVWYGVKMLQQGKIGGEEFTQFLLFSVFIGTALGSLPELFAQLMKTAGSTQRLREILDEVEEAVEDGSRLDCRGEVVLEGVSFAYPSRPEQKVLKEVSFRAAAGQRIAIVGPSGAGKSTLISMLFRFYQPDSGRIFLDGKPVEEYPLGAYRNTLALVPQEVLLFGGSIRDNIEYGRPGAGEEEIWEAARKANAHDFIMELPGGYETQVGERGAQLSGGQRQRLAIARAILADPAILILDEATSSLDSESERLIQEALDTLLKGRTSFIIAHRLSTVRHADKIVVLRGGQVVESGTHDELILHDEGTYRMLAALQFSRDGFVD